MSMGPQAWVAGSGCGPCPRKRTGLVTSPCSLMPVTDDSHCNSQHFNNKTRAAHTFLAQGNGFITEADVIQRYSLSDPSPFFEVRAIFALPRCARNTGNFQQLPMFLIPLTQPAKPLQHPVTFQT